MILRHSSVLSRIQSVRSSKVLFLQTARTLEESGFTLGLWSEETTHIFNASAMILSGLGFSFCTCLIESESNAQG